MNKRCAVLAGVLACCLMLAGCGGYMAVMDRFGESNNTPYQCTCAEAAWAWCTITQKDIDYHWPAPPLWCLPLLVIDLPVTALTETLLLPVDCVQIIGCRGQK